MCGWTFSVIFQSEKECLPSKNIFCALQCDKWGKVDAEDEKERSVWRVDIAPDLLDLSLDDPHEAVGVAVVVDGGDRTLRPAHQDQVEVAIAFILTQVNKY